MGCKHKFKSNLEGLSLSSKLAKESLSPYVTIIFCEKCGFVSYNSNRPSDSEDYQSVQIERQNNE